MPHRKLNEIVRGQQVLHVTPDTTIRQAVSQMAERNKATTLILADGELQGIFTERDLVKRVVAPGLDPDKTAISAVMTPSPMVVDGDGLGFEAVRLMHEGGMHHMVVSGLETADSGGTGYAVVSMRDIFGSEMASFEREIEFENKVWEEI